MCVPFAGVVTWIMSILGQLIVFSLQPTKSSQGRFVGVLPFFVPGFRNTLDYRTKLIFVVFTATDPSEHSAIPFFSNQSSWDFLATSDRVISRQRILILSKITDLGLYVNKEHLQARCN